MMHIAMDNIFLKDSMGLMRMMGQEADRMRLRAYLVGGLVRDLLLGKKTCDLDVVIEGDAIEIAKGISRKCQTDLTIYPHFGTATLKCKNGTRIDLASARKEIYDRGGALPRVSPGTLKEDLYRRDFTVNAMAISLNQRFFGNLIDYFGGREDLQKKKIRVFHQNSFVDDPTRILRAIRFEQRLGFKMEPQTKKWLFSAIDQRLDLSVTPRRYFEEFKKILQEEIFQKCLKRLSELGGLKFLDNRFTAESLNSALLSSVHREMMWVEKSVRSRKKFKHWLVVFMATLDYLSIHKVHQLCHKFLISRKDQEKIFLTRRRYKDIAQLENDKIRPSRVYRILHSFSLEAIIFFMAKTRDRAIKKKMQKFLIDYQLIKISTNGNDLLKKGWRSGIEIKRVLENLLYQKIDGLIQTKADEVRTLNQIKKNRSFDGKN